jgi:hypothetical protein
MRCGHCSLVIGLVEFQNSLNGWIGNMFKVKRTTSSPLHMVYNISFFNLVAHVLGEKVIGFKALEPTLC